MGRHSRSEEYRFEVVACFNAGEQPNEVCQKFPEIGRGTIYNWHRAWRKNLDNRQQQPVSNSPPPTPAEVIPIEDSDLDLVRKTLRSIVRGQRKESASVVIQACNCLLRANELARSLPPEPTPSIDIDVDISLLTDEALKLAIAQRRRK